MCKRMLISLFTLLLALPAWAQLTVGDKAPAFKIAAALDGKVQHLALRQMLKKGHPRGALLISAPKLLHLLFSHAIAHKIQ